MVLDTGGAIGDDGNRLGTLATIPANGRYDEQAPTGDEAASAGDGSYRAKGWGTQRGATKKLW
jgi:hypothetical protein